MMWIFSIIIEALKCSRGQKVRRRPRLWKPVHCHHNVLGGVHVSACLWVLCTSREAGMSWVWLWKRLCCKCTQDLVVALPFDVTCSDIADIVDVQIVCKLCSDFWRLCLNFSGSQFNGNFWLQKKKQWAWCSHTVSRFRRDKQTKAFFWRPHIFLWLDTKERQSVTQGAGSLSNWFRLFFPLLWKIGGREGEVQGPALPSQIASPRPSWWCPSPLPG